jgi:hypothetical protein
MLAIPLHFLVTICASAGAAWNNGLTGGGAGRSREDWKLGVENAATGNLSVPCCELSRLTGCDTARQSYDTARPDFFAVIGVQKSGTTSLTNHLNSHPSICVKGESRLMLLLSGGNPADPLDPARGNLATHRLARGCSWGAAKSCSLLGLVDPGGAKNFYDYPGAAARVLHAMQAQQVKLIMLLREPMQRCFSLWRMACARVGFKPCTSPGAFENLVAAERQVELSPTWRHDLVTGLLPNTRVGVFNPVGCIQTGLYGPQLARLRKVGYAATLDGSTESTRLLVLISERFSANHSRELTKVWKYLGVSESVTQSGFDRVGAANLPDGTPFNVTLSHEAVRTMWPLLRNSTEQTYTLLKSRVSEWEAWYANMNKHPNALTRQRSA